MSYIIEKKIFFEFLIYNWNGISMTGAQGRIQGGQGGVPPRPVDP